MELAPLLLDKKNAARLLGISVRKLEYLIADGKLRIRKIGRRTLLRYRDVARFAAEN